MFTLKRKGGRGNQVKSHKPVLV